MKLLGVCETAHQKWIGRLRQFFCLNSTYSCIKVAITTHSDLKSQIIRIYSTILSKHNAGTNMYRQSQTNRRQ